MICQALAEKNFESRSSRAVRILAAGSPRDLCYKHLSFNHLCAEERMAEQAYGGCGNTVRKPRTNIFLQASLDFRRVIGDIR
jgi:hypothetical protein